MIDTGDMTVTTTDILDLMDAITEVRIGNPEFRASVLASLRLTISTGAISSGRLYSLRHDGEVSTIISQGESSLNEDEDLILIEQVKDEREPARDGQAVAYPLSKDRRIYGVMILEDPNEVIGAFLADIFLQWHAVAEFINTEKAELVDENYQLREEIRLQFSEHNIIGVSGSFRRILDSAKRVATSTATVLIQGETGTGKELVARLIHNNSPRANKPFITVNCGALTETLLETELFGHAKGAFTGAIADHKGRFEAAHGGTIFLDEIGEISQAMQVRLLRVLQEMEVVRVGEHKARKLDVRVVAATNRDLQDEVAQGNFRADLFYRLNVVHLLVPPPAPTPRRHTHAHRAFPFGLLPSQLQIHSVHPPGCLGCHEKLRLARQRARTGKLHRKNGGLGPRQRNYLRPPTDQHDRLHRQRQQTRPYRQR